MAGVMRLTSLHSSMSAPSSQRDQPKEPRSSSTGALLKLKNNSEIKMTTHVLVQCALAYID